MVFDKLKISLVHSLSNSVHVSGLNERRRAKPRSRPGISADVPPEAISGTSNQTNSTSSSSCSLIFPVDDQSTQHNSIHVTTPQPLREQPQQQLLPLPPSPPTTNSSSSPSDRHETAPVMMRKLWVKRPGASATLVEVDDNDLVDTVRDAILRKYANSLGRSIDSPDILLKIVTREQAGKAVPTERVLGPEESIGRTLDAYYANGQTIDEALIIEVPQRRTPRPSPRPAHHQISYFVPDHYRPDDAARDYFPPMPLQSPHPAHAQHQLQHPVHSMSVLTTGQLPPLASPGGHSARRHARPKYGRQHTSSPTIMHTQQSNGPVIDPKSQVNGTQQPALPTPPVQPPNEHNVSSITPPNRSSSPHTGLRTKKKKNTSARSTNGDPQQAPKYASASLLDGTVPPINVLIVEDNVINLKLLEAFMKKLKVRWKSAMNGKEAVSMWRTGGFHLVLMDIQLPIMNGLDATKEIRRLEAVNGIGVFSGSPVVEDQRTPCNGDSLQEEDKLPDKSLFKSPVIIVALTASSLQSDRHEALAAGCNDFLTKPVAFMWMERKVTEWGCMQALIDFDGWRKWKEYASAKAAEDPAKRAAEEKDEKSKNKAALKAMFARPPPTASRREETRRDDSPQQLPATNGVPRKPITPASRTHKSNRSGSASISGSLGSLGEVDE